MDELNVAELRKLAEAALAADRGELPFPANLEAQRAMDKVLGEDLLLALLDRLEKAESERNQVYWRLQQLSARHQECLDDELELKLARAEGKLLELRDAIAPSSLSVEHSITQAYALREAQAPGRLAAFDRMVMQADADQERMRLRASLAEEKLQRVAELCEKHTPAADYDEDLVRRRDVGVFELRAILEDG